MHGAIAMKQEIKRASIGPTKERLAKAENHFTVGDDKQGGVIHTFRDAPLDRMFNRSAIGGVEYAALQKYKHHWYHGGLDLGMGSVDLNRIFSSDPSAMSGMAKTEAQAHHRLQWRAARKEIGDRLSVTVDAVVCYDLTLEAAGLKMGWRSAKQASAAATEALRSAGYTLSRFWGIG